jgi:hypothetical protein
MSGVDVQLSVGELTLEALLDLKTGIGVLRDEITLLIKAEYEYQQRGPLFVQLRASAAADSSADDLVLDLGGPAVGRIWEVRRLIVGGVTWDTTASGNAQIFILANPPMLNIDPPLTELADQATTLPAKNFYSTGQFILRNPSRLIVLIDSPTASQVYAATGSVVDRPDVPVNFEFKV